MYWEFLSLDFQTVEGSEIKMKSLNGLIESFQSKAEKFLHVQNVLDQTKGNMRARTNSLYRMLDYFSCCNPKMVGCIM